MSERFAASLPTLRRWWEALTSNSHASRDKNGEAAEIVESGGWEEGKRTSRTRLLSEGQ
jgi:hypothetical protein